MYIHFDNLKQKEGNTFLSLICLKKHEKNDEFYMYIQVI